MNNSRIAYAEVYSFINSLPTQEYKMIPRDVIDYIDWHRDYNYEFKYDSAKNISKQNISKEAAAIITKLYLDFFADKNEKYNINKAIYNNSVMEDIELTKKYNQNDIFKDNTSKIKEKDIVEYKEDKLFTRLKRFIKRIFRTGS